MKNVGRTMGRFSGLTLIALASALRADNPPQVDLPLDQLLATPIKTAAKYEQTLSSVAASVVVISGGEIERYGWTSLTEVLQSIPGFYLTYDRNYTYIGVRGISKPTDANSRIMVLRNGVVLNEEVTGGSLLPGFDAATIDRIEIVRGPGSALYGGHAMLAVVNIITKSADAIDGVGGSVTYGSLDTETGALHMGKTLHSGLGITASGYWRRSQGADLYFPIFATPANNNGIAKDRDYEDLHNFQLDLRKGKFHLSAFTTSRTKGIPTASYATVFNVDSNTTDKQNSLVMEYEVPLGVGKSLDLTGQYRLNRYRGYYPYDDAGVRLVGTDSARGVRIGLEGRFNWDLGPNQRLTMGIEISRDKPLNYDYVVGDYQIHLSRPYTRSSSYLQDEYHPSTKLSIVAGVRYDTSYTRSSTSPRVAILYAPRPSTTIKLLYGTAFRAPTLYESEFSDPLTPWKKNPDLQPETIRTTELVLEQRVSPEVFLVGSLFRIGASGLIDNQIDPADSVGWYRNVGSLDSSGGEVNVEMRRQNGLWGHLGVSLLKAREGSDPASNSPRTMFKAGISSSPGSLWQGGLQATYESSRLTRDGESTASVILLNGTASRSLGRGLRIGLTAGNLLNRHYSTPVGPELLPESIQQDGRTFALKLSYSR